MIKKLLDSQGDDLYSYMPVPGGYGRSTLDYLCCFRGRFFVIEAKKLGGHPTERQSGIIADIATAGGKVFVVDGDASLFAVATWFESVIQEDAKRVL